MERKRGPTSEVLPDDIDIHYDRVFGISYIFRTLTPIDRVFIFALFLIPALIVVVSIRFYAFTPQPPFRFGSDVYYPSKEVYCPGEVIYWTDLRYIQREDVLVTVESSLWSVDNELTILPGTPEDTKIYIWTDTNVITNVQTYHIPDSIQPGHYERRVASNHSRGDEIYSVPFEVAADCDEEAEILRRFQGRLEEVSPDE